MGTTAQCTCANFNFSNYLYYDRTIIRIILYNKNTKQIDKNNLSSDTVAH